MEDCITYLYVISHHFRQSMLSISKQNKLFPVIVVLKLLLKSNNQWNEFFCFIKYLINKFNHVVNLGYNDFPSDWESILSSK